MTRYKIGLGMVCLVLCLMVVSPGIAPAALTGGTGEVDSHDYIAAPPGTDITLWYYRSLSAVQMYGMPALGGEPGKRGPDIDIHATIGILRHIHYMKLPGTNMTIDPQIVLPFGYKFATFPASLGGGTSGSSGMADLTFLVTFWFVNDPANKQWFGLTPWISLPTGDYDSSRAVNLGENRVMGRLQAGYVKGWGDWILSLNAEVDAYTNNNKYAGECTMKQDPLYGVEAHITYNFTPSFFMGLEYFYTTGGKTKVNDVDQNDETQYSKVALTSSFWTSPRTNLLVKYGLTVDEKNGPKVNEFQIRFAYVW
jgi:hypothetical protein